jgi:PAS domain S-box-containing protein
MHSAAPPRPPAPPGTGIPLDTIYDEIDHGIAVIDRSGRFVTANKATLRVLGFPSREALLRTPVEVVRDRFLYSDAAGTPIPAGQTPVAQAMNGLRPNSRILRCVPRDGGAELWLSVRAIPLLDDSGHLKAVISVTQDLTESHENTRRLEESEARFRELVEATDDLVSWSDMEGRTVYVNSRARDFLGRDPSELIGEDGRQQLHPDDLPACDAAFADWMSRGGEDSLTLEYRLLPSEGAPRRVSARVTVARDGRGQVVGVRNISRDITAVHAAREALEALTAALEAAIPAAEAGVQGLPDLLDACRAAFTSWNGSLPLPADDPVVRLLDVGQRIIAALHRVVPDTGGEPDQKE